MTYVDAEPVLGCSKVKIAALVKAGRIRSREQAWRNLPSLWRADVERVAGELAGERQAAEERRAARPPSAAPDDDNVWLSTTEAALVIGLTPTGVLYRAERGLIPHERRGNRLRFRREHVEQVAAARVFGARKDEQAQSVKLR